MRYPPLTFFFLPLLTLLTACAGPGGLGRMDPPSEGTSDTPPLVAEPARTGEPVPDPAQGAGELPEIELSGPLLYQILEAEMALQRQHFGLGIDRYAELARTTRDPRFAERSAQAALFTQQDEAALEAARLWAELAPDRSEAHQAMVVAAVRNGSLDEAMAHMEELLASRDGLPDERFEVMANLLSREHDVHHAFELMEQFVSERHDNASALYAYAHLAVRAGQLNKALPAVDRALELRPGWYNAIALRVRIMLLSNGAAEALDYLADAVRKFPDDAELRTVYARSLVEAERFEEALAQYGALDELGAASAESWLAMGMIYLQTDRIDEAEEMLRRAQEARGGQDIQFYLGWIAERRNDIPQAIAHYSSLSPDSPNHFEARVRIAVLTAEGGDLASARRQLHELNAADPERRKRLYQVESELLRRAARPADAMQVLNLALEEFPTDFNLLYARALIAETMGMLDLLERDLREIIDRDPDHVDALNALGYTLADRTDRFREAYEYISRALELRPDNNAILDSMGWVLYRLGNYEEAIRYLRRSLEMKLDHEVAAHLGEVLWVSGEREEAIAVWERALEEFPEEEILRETMQRFGR